MADHSVEANRKGVMESGQSQDLGRQGGSSSSYRTTTFSRRRSTSNHGSWSAFNAVKYARLVRGLILVVLVLCLFGFYHAHLSDELSIHGWFSSASVLYAGSGEGRSMLSAAADLSNSNCTKTYTAVAGETCATLRSSQGLTQPQIFELNPALNCKNITTGQAICVAGISAHCGQTISVKKGPTNITCASIEASKNLTTEGFAILNPGISCPEAPGNNNSWTSSQLVCIFPGLGNIFFEYMGASGLPITFDDVSPLVQEFSFVSYHVILAFAIDVDANGIHTNGTFYPYWSNELTPAAATAFKAANPGVQILISLGGASKYVSSNDTVTVTWVEPKNTADWIANAESSLTTLVNEYSIDGIDIDYENFPNGSTNFAYCIGTLIEKLKASNTIGLATIAPFGAVLSEYQNLTSRYGDQVDYINFQFYAYQLHSIASYISEYNTIAYLFPPWKLMASTAIGGNNSITGTSFVSAVDQIQKSRGLAGVMLYDADHSVSSNFTDEKEILSLLNAGGSGSPTPPAPPVGLAPGPGPAPSPGSGVGGAPKSSLAPVPSSGSAIAPGAPTPSSGGKAPKSGPAESPQSGHGGAPKSGPAASPQSGHGGAPKSGPAASPQSGHGGAPKSSLAPGTSLAPGSPSTPGSGGGPPGSGGGGNATAPAPSSAPGRFLRGRWAFQGFGLVATVFVLLFSL